MARRSSFVLGALASIALAVLVAGCARPLTQIVLVVESDLSVPNELDRIEVLVLGPSGQRMNVGTDLGVAGAPGTPYTLGVTPGGSRLGPLHIRVTALRRGRRVVERTIRTEFEQDRSVTLVVRLERACAPVFCSVETTCAVGACIDPYVPGHTLPRFGGIVFDRDAGVACTGAPGAIESCDGIDQDCDGIVDEGFDVDVDPAHCGVCGNACGAGTACVRGTCGDPAVQLALGQDHSCALRASGRVVCWGANEVGQLADDTRTDHPTAVEIAGVEDAITVGTGERHACALERSGALRCWGWNQKGQLGDGTRSNRDAPVEVALEGVVELGVGYEHTCARTGGGEVWCWGSLTGVDAASGALADEPRPHAIAGIVDPIAIEGGNESTCALQATGRIVCWGQNESGRLGDGTFDDHAAPRPILEPAPARSIGRFGFGFYAIAEDGVTWGWGRNGQAQLARLGIDVSPRPLSLVGIDGSTEVSGGREHGCARAGDRVRCWGADMRAQLGRGTILGDIHAVPEDVVGLPSGILELAVGAYHACVRTSGEVWCWGANGRGELGDGTFVDSPTPVRVVLPAP